MKKFREWIEIKYRGHIALSLLIIALAVILIRFLGSPPVNEWHYALIPICVVTFSQWPDVIANGKSKRIFIWFNIFTSIYLVYVDQLQLAWLFLISAWFVATLSFRYVKYYFGHPFSLPTAMFILTFIYFFLGGFIMWLSCIVTWASHFIVKRVRFGVWL